MRRTAMLFFVAFLVVMMAGKAGAQLIKAKQLDPASFRDSVRAAERDSLILLKVDGSATNPAFSFFGDQNTGFYRKGADSLGVATGGTDAFRVGLNAVTFLRLILAPDGSAANPGFAFSSDTNTGVFRLGPDSVALVTGGVVRARFGATTNSAFSVAGAWAGDVVSSSSGFENATKTISTGGRYYILDKNNANGSSSSTTFNITGVPNDNGAWLKIKLTDSNGSTGGSNSTAIVQINGTQVAQLTVAGGGLGTTVSRYFTAERIASAWVLTEDFPVGSNAGAPSTAIDANTFEFNAEATPSLGKALGVVGRAGNGSGDYDSPGVGLSVYAGSAYQGGPYNQGGGSLSLFAGSGYGAASAGGSVYIYPGTGSANGKVYLAYNGSAIQGSVVVGLDPSAVLFGAKTTTANSTAPLAYFHAAATTGTDNQPVVTVSQGYASSSGNVLNILNSGTGYSFVSASAGSRFQPNQYITQWTHANASIVNGVADTVTCTVTDGNGYLVRVDWSGGRTGVASTYSAKEQVMSGYLNSSTINGAASANIISQGTVASGMAITQAAKDANSIYIIFTNTSGFTLVGNIMKIEFLDAYSSVSHN